MLGGALLGGSHNASWKGSRLKCWSAATVVRTAWLLMSDISWRWYEAAFVAVCAQILRQRSCQGKNLVLLDQRQRHVLVSFPS
jgi:hypothetical protein